MRAWGSSRATRLIIPWTHSPSLAETPPVAAVLAGDAGNNARFMKTSLLVPRCPSHVPASRLARREEPIGPPSPLGTIISPLPKAWQRPPATTSPLGDRRPGISPVVSRSTGMSLTTAGVRRPWPPGAGSQTPPPGRAGQGKSAPQQGRHLQIAHPLDPLSPACPFQALPMSWFCFGTPKRPADI
jgi:hypothetical protein